MRSIFHRQCKQLEKVELTGTTGQLPGILQLMALGMVWAQDTAYSTGTFPLIGSVPMDEGTIKTPIPKCRLYWCFCLGWCSNFVGSELHVYIRKRGKGGGGQGEDGGATFHKRGRKYQND
jgi:hypothetical protein